MRPLGMPRFATLPMSRHSPASTLRGRAAAVGRVVLGGAAARGAIRHHRRAAAAVLALPAVLDGLFAVGRGRVIAPPAARSCSVTMLMQLGRLK